MKRFAPSCAVTTLCLLPSLAYAGGIEVPDLGAKSLGRGSAFVARADDLSAMYFNPAGLSKTKGFNVHIGLNVLNMNAAFTRGGADEWVCLPGAPDDCDITDPSTGAVYDPMNDPIGAAPTGDDTAGADPFRTVRNRAKITPLPTVVLQYGDVGKVEGLAIAAGLLAPTAFGFPEYEAEGPQRYALRGAEALLVYPGVGISYRINRYISLGGVFLNGITHAKFNQAARGTINVNSSPYEKELPEADADFAIEVRDWSSPVGIFGVMSNPIDELELGVSVRTPVKVDARGSLEYSSSADLEGRSGLVCAGFDWLDTDTDKPTQSQCDGVAFEQNLPWILRAGARYIHPRFDVEVDYVYEAWGATPDGFNIDMCDADDVDSGSDVCTSAGAMEVGINNLGEIPVLDTVLLKNFRDVHSVRLGSDVAVLPQILDIRAGGWWQSSAYPKNHETFSVDFPVSMQVAVTAGLTWHAIPRKERVPHKQDNWLDVTVGYSHVFQPTVTVTEGILQQQSIRDPALPPYGNVINNGTYAVNFNVFGLALEGHF
jgi:long-chain fatty acid transport protein